MKEPCCPKCDQYSILGLERTFAGVEGILVFCTNCGAIISWAPKPKKK